MDIFKFLRVAFLVFQMLLSLATLNVLPLYYPEIAHFCTQTALLFIAMISCYYLIGMCFVHAIPNEKLRHLVSNGLFGPSRQRQRTVIGMLCFAFGNRFGSPSVLSRQKHDLCCRLWQRWWDENKDQVVWCAELGIWVEKQLLSSECEIGSIRSGRTE